MPIDLMSTEFSSCVLLKALPKMEKLFYQGVMTAPFQKYRAEISGAGFEIFTVSVIRRDEVMMWDGSKDLLARSVKDAALRVRGTYSFELLAFNALNELQTFNPGELAQVLINSSQRLRPGDEIVIRYSSLYGILRKLGDETWGKISFYTFVEVLSPKPESLYQLLDKALKMAGEILLPVSVLMTDLSAVPLLNCDCVDQKAALGKLSIKMAKKRLPAKRVCLIDGIYIWSGE